MLPASLEAVYTVLRLVPVVTLYPPPWVTVAAGSARDSLCMRILFAMQSP